MPLSSRSPKMVLLAARGALKKALSLHISSVRIGELGPVLDSGCAGREMDEARGIIEEMDLACAEIDKHLLKGKP